MTMEATGTMQATGTTHATAVILAAGLGTRMKSALPKTLHPIAGRPMLRHLLASCEAVFDRIVVVVGPGMEAVAAGGRAARGRRAAASGSARRTPRLQAAAHFGDGRGRGALRRQPADPAGDAAPPARAPARRATRAGAAGDAPADPGALRAGDRAGTAMSSASSSGPMRREAERAETLCNAGVLCAAAADMARWLAAVRERQRQARILPDRHRRARRGRGQARRRGRGAGRGAARASTRGPSWPRPRRWCSGGCACAAMEAGVTLIDPARRVPVAPTPSSRRT